MVRGPGDIKRVAGAGKVTKYKYLGDFCEEEARLAQKVKNRAITAQLLYCEAY